MVGFTSPCYTSRTGWVKWWVLHCLPTLPVFNESNDGFYIALLYLYFEWVTSFFVLFISSCAFSTEGVKQSNSFGVKWVAVGI